MQVGIIGYNSFNTKNNRKIGTENQVTFQAKRLPELVKLNNQVTHALNARGENKIVDPKIRILLTEVANHFKNDSNVLVYNNILALRNAKRTILKGLNSGNLEKQKSAIDTAYKLRLDKNCSIPTADFWKETVLGQAEKQMKEGNRALADYLLDITKFTREDLLNDDCSKLFERLEVLKRFATKEHLEEVKSYCLNLEICGGFSSKYFIPFELDKGVRILHITEAMDSISNRAEKIYKTLISQQ